MLVVSGVEPAEERALERVREALSSGAALDVFRRIVEHQGGDPRVIDDYRRLPSAPHEHRVTAQADGFVSLEAEAIGRAAVVLGAGRTRMEDRVDPAVGIEILARHGTAVRAGDPVLLVRYDGSSRLDGALQLLNTGVGVVAEPPQIRPLVLERIVNG